MTHELVNGLLYRQAIWKTAYLFTVFLQVHYVLLSFFSLFLLFFAGKINAQRTCAEKHEKITSFSSTEKCQTVSADTVFFSAVISSVSFDIEFNHWTNWLKCNYYFEKWM